MKKAPIYISSRIFIPSSKVDPDQLEKYYSFQNYDEKKCNSCRVYKDGQRHNEVCDECPAYLGIAELWKDTKIKGVDYIGLPPGRPARIEKIFNVNLEKAIDLRPEIPLHKDLKFIGKLRTGKIVDGKKTVNQVKMVRDWLENSDGSGIIQVPPRGGKTVTAVSLSVQLGFRTLVITNKIALLKQFYNTMMGSKVREPQTNAKELEKKLGRKLVVLVQKPSDLAIDCDYMLVNYQKFIRNPASIAKIGKYLNNKFTTLVLDEGHRAGADAFLKFISRLNCKYRITLSATPLRKDGKDRLLKEFMGGVAAKSDVVAKIPKIELVETGIYVKRNYTQWYYAMRHLAVNKQRNILIVKDVFKDLRAGHHSIIIPVDYVQHGNTLLKMINRQAQVNNIKRKENWPEPMATFYTSAVKKSEKAKDKLLADVDKGKFKVMIAIRSMINEGIDLAHPTMMYNVVPCSANTLAGSPLFFQLSSRIATWHKDKKQPIIRLYLDGMAQSVGCLRSLWWMEIWKHLRKTPDHPQRYLIDDVEKNRIIQILKNKEYIPPNLPGVRSTSKEIMQLEKPATKRGFSSF